MPSNASLVDRFEAAATLGSTLAGYTAARGVDLETLARPLGLDPARFGDFSARVGLDGMCRLFEALAIVLNDDLFGLHLADTFERGMSGAYGYGLMSAPTFGEALRFVVRHGNVVAQMQRCDLVVGDAEARLEWTYSALIVRRDQFVDFATALHMARFADIVGTETRRARIALERPPPRDAAAYRQHLSPRTVFAAASNAIAFPQSLLAMENPRADARLFRLMDEQCAAMHRPLPGREDLLTALKLHIVDRFGEGTATLESAARHVGMSERTLQRRLARQGLTLNGLIDETRKEFAARLLRETDRSVASVGYQLGFSQPSAFTRSARRWFNMAPLEVRQHYRRDEASERSSRRRHPGSGLI
jgi:AraC-like DNA-binding protein